MREARFEPAIDVSLICREKKISEYLRHQKTLARGPLISYLILNMFANFVLRGIAAIKAR